MEGNFDNLRESYGTRRRDAMAVFAVDDLKAHEREQIEKYAEYVTCTYIGGYLITVRSVHHEPQCPHQPVAQLGRAEMAGRLLRCSVMPNGVHVHLYIDENNERSMRFVEVSDEENEELFEAYYG
jgi:hypothetical protein